jgi:hypothetical protein
MTRRTSRFAFSSVRSFAPHLSSRDDLVRVEIGGECLGVRNETGPSGGLLLLAFHVGDEVVHFDELWGQAVSVDFHFFRSDEVADSLRSAGFAVEKIVERDPYVEVEAQTRRGYILASKRGTG